MSEVEGLIKTRRGTEEIELDFTCIGEYCKTVMWLAETIKDSYRPVDCISRQNHDKTCNYK